MARYILCYLVTLGAFLAIDFVWLAWIARRLYAAELGSLLRKQPVFAAAGAFYLLFAAGLAFFAVMPGIDAGSSLQAGARGAALGLVAYGTYNLTNHAVLAGFGLKIALIDLAWGAAASATASTIAYFAVGSAL